MGTISKTLENLFAAVAFAEIGEFDTARQVAAEHEPTAKAATKKQSHDRHGMIHTIPATES